MKYLFLVYVHAETNPAKLKHICLNAIFSSVVKCRAWLKASKHTEKSASVYRMLRDPVPSMAPEAELVTCWQTWEDGK